MTADPGSERKDDAKRSVQLAVEALKTETDGLLAPDRDPEAADPGPADRKNTPRETEAEGATRFFDRTERLFRVASLLAISGSAVLAAYQFYQSRIDERKEHSVELMNAWQGSDARKAYARLSGALEERLDKAGPVEKMTSTALVQYKRAFGAEMIREWSDGQGIYGGWAEDIDTVFDYYSEVEFCIRAELCDDTLLTAYFGDQARSFWEYFRAYADQRRSSFYPDYGLGLESFVSSL